MSFRGLHKHICTFQMQTMSKAVKKITEIQGRKKIPSNELELNCFWRGGDCSPEGKFIREESMLSGHWPANPDYRITMP